MEIIELDQEYFDTLRKLNREGVINGIVDNVMSGKIEYHGVGEKWVLQDLINDALGEQEVCELICKAVTSKLDDDMRYAMEQVHYTARESLRCLVVSKLNSEM